MVNSLFKRSSQALSENSYSNVDWKIDKTHGESELENRQLNILVLFYYYFSSAALLACCSSDSAL